MGRFQRNVITEPAGGYKLKYTRDIKVVLTWVLDKHTDTGGLCTGRVPRYVVTEAA